MATFSEVEAHLQNLRDDVNGARQRYAQAVAAITQTDSTLANLATVYASDINDINALLAANPSDVACQNLSARKARIVADGQALKVTVAAAKAALAAP